MSELTKFKFVFLRLLNYVNNDILINLNFFSKKTAKKIKSKDFLSSSSVFCELSQHHQKINKRLKKTKKGQKGSDRAGIKMVKKGI